MISHDFPKSALSTAICARIGSVGTGAAGLGNGVFAGLMLPREWVGGRRRDEPLRVELHVAARCQGTNFDSCGVPASARPRWVRWTLLLSDARPAGARRRRQCAARRDRAADHELFSLFGRTR